MYSKDNLSTKTPEELVEIARALGSDLNLADGVDALISFITSGQQQEGSDVQVKRKRTRITAKKDDQVYTAKGADGENLDSPKKRRGRKPKAAEETPLFKDEMFTEPIPQNQEVVVEEKNELPAEVAPETTEPTEPAATAEAKEETTDDQATLSAPEPVKKRRGRRTKAEIEAAAAAAAEELARMNRQRAQMDAIPESDATDNSNENLNPELIAELQAKVSAHNDTAADADDFVWEGDPADGTDFIIVRDLPIADYNDNYDAGDYDNESYNSYLPANDAKRPDFKEDDAKSFDFDDIVTMNGVLEVMPDGFGFLRSSDYNYLSSPDDVCLTAQQIKRHSLKTGDVVECKIRPPREGEKFFNLSNIIKVNGCEPAKVRDRVAFENLTPLFPEEKFTLCGDPATTNQSVRIVDLFSPIGKGQRALIVAQPKTGKTILMKDIANAISANHPEAYLMMLLIDERPEEVTDMARTVNAEVIASTFDEPADHHVKIANLVLEKAKRLVECGHDVVIFLDSITRLARAYNTVAPASGKILTGGVDANALQKPKRFFGAARNIEGGGSLTIIATALIDTGSKMDEVIFEEFKGTGNMELQLDRQLSNKRIFPAVNLVQSSTRRDDLLQDETTLNRMWILRKHIADMNAMEAMNEIYGRMERTRSNEEFLISMNG